MIFSIFRKNQLILLIHEISEMELLSSKLLVSSTHTKFPATHSVSQLQTRYLGTNFQYFPLNIRSKKSSYQDFREYAKPSRLLPAREVKVCTDASVENAATSFRFGRSAALYKVKIQTSKIYGSGLSDMSSGILLCLIDENGSSILQRLPATSCGTDTYETLHFQRGSVDEFTFEGPNLGRIEAIWIGSESGQWRIAGISLSVIHDSQPSSAGNDQDCKQLTGLQYNFAFEDMLIGEKSDASMMEFRPHSVTAFCEDESTLLNGKSSNASPLLDSYLTSNEESMKEYADLKFSLLFYDAVLILSGSSIASFLTGENALYAFLTGGLFGFFYLLLLQRSVDGLPAPDLIPTETKLSFGQLFQRLKGPISALVLVFTAAIITVKYASGEDAVKLTPKDLIFGMMGFLMCKVSVVLAACKPMPLSLRDSKQSS
ncbi:hypothetical protein CDL12_15565 [Handroanthus impetiginosus]|uniref:DUF7755 domain-containing protein n=1 Tax=Handroanthus impetiginosus TaxID=429701 RepID=A0A2G9H3H2_9LAMI|nr:hypothetical protein CDL12_15565 [Handroanthus impetiginosus]